MTFVAQWPIDSLVIEERQMYLHPGFIAMHRRHARVAPVGWLYVASARVQNAERVCVHAVQQGHTSGAQPTNQPSITTHVKRKEEMEEAQSGKRTCG